MFSKESEKNKERLSNQQTKRTIQSRGNKEPKRIVQDPSCVKSSQETFTIVQDDYTLICESPSELLIVAYLIRMAKMQKSNKVLVKAKSIMEHTCISNMSLWRHLNGIMTKGYIKSKSQKGYFTEIEIDIERINEEIKKKKDEFQVSE